MATAVLEELVQFIAASLVDRPEAVDVRAVAEAQSVAIELRVAKEDLGKIIGKHGRMARAIRTVVAAAATKAGTRCTLEILE